MVGVFGRAAPSYEQVGPKPFAHFGRRLVELAELRPTDGVLDVATGRGAVLFPAAERAARVVGIDLAEPMVVALADEIRARGVQNAEARLMDAEVLAFDDATFDVVLCNLSLFLFDAERCLQDCRRVLKPGGRLGFTDFGKGDPRWDWHRERLRSLRDESAPRREDRQQPDQHDEIELALTSLGFESVRLVEESHDLVFADADEWWRWVWSQGQRGFLEHLDEERLERYREDVCARLPDPIVNTWTVLFALAHRH